MDNKYFNENFQPITMEVKDLMTKNINQVFSTRELYRRFELTPIQLRRVVHYLRVQGTPIISKGTGGYYMTDNELDVMKMMISLSSRAKSILSASYGLDNWLKNKQEYSTT